MAGSPLQKVRTFRDDINRSRGAASNQPAQPHTPTPPPKEKSVPARTTVADSAPAQQNEDPKAATLSLDEEPATNAPQPTTKEGRQPAPHPTVEEPASAKTPTTTQHQETGQTPTQHTQRYAPTDDSGIRTDEGSLGDFGSAMIVTDKKRERTRFIPAVISALSDWFTDTKETIEEKRTGYTVAPAKERSEVISKAAQQSARAPSDDYKPVTSRLRHVPRAQPKMKPDIKEAAAVPKPTWGTATPPQQPTHSASPQKTQPPSPPTPRATTPANEVPIKTRPGVFTPRTTPAQPTPATSPERKAPTDAPQPVAPAKPKQTTAKTQPPATATPAPSERPAPESAPQHAPHKSSQDRQQTPSPTQTVPAEETQTDTQQQPQSDGLSLPWKRFALYGALGLVAIAAVGGGISAGIWLFGGSDGDGGVRTQEEPIRERQFSNSAQVAVALPRTGQELLQTLDARIDSANAPRTEFVLTTSGGRAASAGTVVDVLDLTAPGGFTRRIERIDFGATATGAPLLLIGLPNFDVALGGMLAWEDNIQSDLAPLFGTPVTRTVVPDTIGAADETPHFVDESYENRDLRVLYNGGGEVAVAYMFINQRTVLISTSRNELIEAARALQ